MLFVQRPLGAGMCCPPKFEGLQSSYRPMLMWNYALISFVVHLRLAFQDLA